MIKSSIHVTIRDLAQKIFEGDVMAISSTNEKGAFDILHSHSNFISLIKDKITLTNLDGTKQQINLKSGVIRNVNNSVEVFLGVESL